MAVSLDPAAVVAPQSVVLLIDRIPQVAARTGKPPGTPFRVGIATTGPEREFLLEAQDSVSLCPLPPGAAAAAAPGVRWIRMPAEALLRLVYGRLDPDHTPPVDSLSGAIDLGILRATFPGF